MTDYGIASKSDRTQLIDFINYVFSLAYRPHNFKTLLPKEYSDDVPEFKGTHFIAKQDGKLRAAITNYPCELSVCGKTLKCGCIGNVAVHPYSRGEGHMKVLMKNMREDAKENGFDILSLGGLRHRYGYFGFEKGGLCLNFNVSSVNIRHCLKDADISDYSLIELTEKDHEAVKYAKVLYEKRLLHSDRDEENFVRILKSYSTVPYSVYRGGKMIGYLCKNFSEIILENEAELPKVIKVAFEKFSLNESNISVSPFEKERIAVLKPLCEGYLFKNLQMICVLCWKNVIDALLALKSTYSVLKDMERNIEIEGEKLHISVKNGIPSVTDGFDGSDIISLDHMEATRVFFGLDGLIMPDERFESLIPLPFYIDKPDFF